MDDKHKHLRNCVVITRGQTEVTVERAALKALLAERDALREALEAISNSSMDEGGCFYTNRINIKRARAVLAL